MIQQKDGEFSFPGLKKYKREHLSFYQSRDK